MTLTTVGYGDVLPRSQAARTMAIFEAVMGQIYLAVLVARLVGLHIVHATGLHSDDKH
jgi:voltage-gated potassium channel